MKNKFVFMFFMVIAVFSISACGKEYDSARNTLWQSETKTEQEKTEEKNDVSWKEDSCAWFGKNSCKQKKRGEKEEKKFDAGAMLGSDFDEQYDGFVYLQSETLTLKPDEYQNRTAEKELKIFLPFGEYTSVNESFGYAYSRGMDMKVSFSPYLLGEGAYTLKEHLEYHLEAEYDVLFSMAVYDLELSETEVTENGVRAVAKYCYYDKWTDSYMPVYCTYYLTQVAGEKVLVEVKINLMDVKDGMEEMLAELEKFYGFAIAWDAGEAQKKLDDFIAAGVPDTIRAATGYILFELPKGWGEDYSYYDESTFAPGGSVADAGCAVSISHEYMGSDKIDITEILSSQEAREAYIADFAENAPYELEDVKMEFYGSTCMGEAMKFSFVVKDGGHETKSAIFFITNENYFSLLTVMATSDRYEETLAVAENILANGRMY